MDRDELKELVKQEIKSAMSEVQVYDPKDVGKTKNNLTIRRNMYELSDSVIGINEMANVTDDKNIKKFFKQLKALQYKLESYLHKNYKGWD